MRREYTAQEAEQFSKAEEQLSKNGLDKWTQEGIQRNVDLIDQFFQSNPTVAVTLQTIYRAIEERKTEFSWLSPAASEWHQTALLNPILANQLAEYIASTSGQPGALAKDGDDLFVNLLLIFNQIDSRRETFSAHSLAAAKDRILHSPGRQLVYVAQPRKTEPTSRAAKEDDSTSTNWLGRDMVRNADGSIRSKTPAEQRADREAAEREKQTPVRQFEPDAWQRLCDQLLNYGSRHSQKAAMRETYDRGVENGKSFREIYVEMDRLRKSYEFSPAPLTPSVKSRSI